MPVDDRRSGGLVGRLQEAVETRTGKTIADADRLERLEEAAREGMALKKELDLIGWTALDFLSGQSQELKFVERRKLAQQARMVWSQDPQAGAAVDLSNDFVFGRGVQKPKCKDKKVQKVVDKAWDDPDNQLVLTSFEAQVALNTDLELQSNVFLVMFDDGEDGAVKLGLLNHDEVETAVRDPENRLRVLYYMATKTVVEWDYKNDRAVVPKGGGLNADGRRPIFYYEHWRNVQQAEEEQRQLDKPPAEKLGDGRVRHIAVNRTSEMVFGIPTMRRTIRWYTAYNDFMKARVDMAQAAAAFIMKRSSKSTPNQLAKLASRAVSQGENPRGGPAPASILNENESVKHDNMSLNSGAGNAVQDGQMIRSQVSAATHWPQHYLGDAGSANLATATSMELPVLKHVEARQEVWEGTFRWFIDRVIERAVDAGLISEQADDPEVLDGEVVSSRELGAPQFSRPQGPMPEGMDPNRLNEAYMDQGEDEADTKRDLSYEFAMPNPLKRTMTDLVSAVANIARTFDPNNTNPELSRVLLGVVLSEGLELDDAAGLVDSIYPEGYVDPALAAAQAQQQAAADQGSGEENPYGAPMQATLPEDVQEAMFDTQFAAHPVPGAWLGFVAQLPEGDPFRAVVERKLGALKEARFTDLPEQMQIRGRGRITDAERDFQETVGVVLDDALTTLVHVGSGGHNGMNGNGTINGSPT